MDTVHIDISCLPVLAISCYELCAIRLAEHSLPSSLLWLWALFCAGGTRNEGDFTCLWPTSPLWPMELTETISCSLLLLGIHRDSKVWYVILCVFFLPNTASHCKGSFYLFRADIQEDVGLIFLQQISNTMSTVSLFYKLDWRWTCSIPHDTSNRLFWKIICRNIAKSHSQRGVRDPKLGQRNNSLTNPKE